MDEREFKRLLALFPVVRSRDYVADDGSSRQLASSSSSRDESVRDWQDAWDDGDRAELDSDGPYQSDSIISVSAAFWEKLKSAAQKKVGEAQSDRICSAFRQLHQKLVFEEVSSNAAEKFVKSRGRQ